MLRRCGVAAAHRAALQRPDPPGGLFALYVFVYSIGRLWIETLRIDPSHEIGGIRLNVFVAAAAIVLSAAFFVVWQRRWKRGGPKPAKVETMAVPKGR